MARYIDAEKLCKGLKEMASVQYLDKQNTILGVVSTIENTPPADVVEVRHGEWEPTNIPAYFGGVIYECSLCGAKDGDHTKILGKYCWRCGAKMDGERRDT